MDASTALGEFAKLTAAGYQPLIFHNGKAIRLRRGDVLFCPLGALCHYYERHTMRGIARRMLRRVRSVRWRRTYRFESDYRIANSYGPVSSARLWARIALAMHEPETDKIVRAADGWDERADRQYDRAIRAAMLKTFGLPEVAA